MGIEKGADHRRWACIAIMEVMEEWNEENGFETSGAMDMEIAKNLYSVLFPANPQGTMLEQQLDISEGAGRMLAEEYKDLSDRLAKIADIIETVDRRAQFGAVVTPTLEEMTQDEMSEIYKLAKGTGECDLCKKDGALFSSIYGNLCQKCNEEAEHDHHEDSNPRLDGESA